MPADADLLCGLYLSSQLSGGGKSTHQLQHQNQIQRALQQTQTSTSFTLETIDFVKYTKTPMSDGLKRKYELLVGGNHHQNHQTSSIAQSQLVVNISETTSSLKTAVATTNGHSPTTQNGHSKPTNGTNGQLVNGSSAKTVNSVACIDLSWSRIRKTGIGLHNLGNNCYLNATLQCLAYTAPLSQWLVTRPHSPACRFRPLKGFCSLCEVERIVFDIFNSAGGGGYGCAKPNNLCFNIKS